MERYWVYSINLGEEPEPGQVQVVTYADHVAALDAERAKVERADEELANTVEAMTVVLNDLKAQLRQRDGEVRALQEELDENTEVTLKALMHAGRETADLQAQLKTLADKNSVLEGQLRQRDEQHSVDIANSLRPFKAGDWIRFKWFHDEAEGLVTGHRQGAVLFTSVAIGEGFIELQNIVAHVSRQQQTELSTLRTLVGAAVEAMEHCEKVFVSMSDRGSYPLELIPFEPKRGPIESNPLFLGKQGWIWLKNAMEPLKATLDATPDATPEGA